MLSQIPIYVCDLVKNLWRIVSKNLSSLYCRYLYKPIYKFVKTGFYVAVIVRCIIHLLCMWVWSSFKVSLSNTLYKKGVIQIPHLKL